MLNFIKTNFLFLLLATLMIAGSLFALLNKDRGDKISNADITVTNSIGIVSVKYPRELWWRGVEIDDHLPHSSIVKTSRDSFARLLFATGEELLLGPMAFVRISSPDKNGKLKIKVFSGQISFIKLSKATSRKVKNVDGGVVESIQQTEETPTDQSSNIVQEESLILIETAKVDEPETKEVLDLRKEAVSERLVTKSMIDAPIVETPAPAVEVVQVETKEEVKMLPLVKLEKELINKEIAKVEREKEIKEEILKVVEERPKSESIQKAEVKIINELPPMKKISLPDTYEVEAE